MAESLAERKRRVDEELVQLRAALKQSKTECKHLARDWVLTEEMRAIAICVYMLADMEVEPVVAYLRGVGSMWHFSALDDDGLALFAIDLFSNASDD